MDETLFSFSHIGTKEVQEDVMISFTYKDYKCYFIFDGHGFNQNKISLVHFLQDKNFFINRFKNFFRSNELNKKTLCYFFKELDDFITMKNIVSGACFAGILINKNHIMLLNLGDCYFYIFDGKTKNIILESPVHDLSNPKEVARIRKMNMEKHIVDGRYKKLAITRVLGDSDCKGIDNEPLIAIPNVLELKNDKPFFFFLTTDGIKMNYSLNEIARFSDNKIELEKYLTQIARNNLTLNKNIDNFYCILLRNKNSNNMKTIKSVEKKMYEDTSVIKSIADVKSGISNFNLLILDNINYYYDEETTFSYFYD